MKLCAKVVVAKQQWPAIMQAFAPMMDACLDVVLFKFVVNEDC